MTVHFLSLLSSVRLLLGIRNLMVLGMSSMGFCIMAVHHVSFTLKACILWGEGMSEVGHIEQP